MVPVRSPFVIRPDMVSLDRVLFGFEQPLMDYGAADKINSQLPPTSKIHCRRT